MELYQCPYNKSCKCAMTDPCLGCEDFNPSAVEKQSKQQSNCNKPAVSSCCRKKIPLINKASVSRSIYLIKDPVDLEYKIYEAGFKAGIKQFRLINNC